MLLTVSPTPVCNVSCRSSENQSGPNGWRRRFGNARVFACTVVWSARVSRSRCCARDNVSSSGLRVCSYRSPVECLSGKVRWGLVQDCDRQTHAAYVKRYDGAPYGQYRYASVQRDVTLAMKRRASLPLVETANGFLFFQSNAKYCCKQWP